MGNNNFSSMGLPAPQIVALLVLLAILTGCTATGPRGRPSSPPFTGTMKAQQPLRPQSAVEEDGEVFASLSAKMDEYQDLMAVCERLSKTEENKEISESCSARLRALREELVDLTNRLQVKPE